MKKYYKTIIKFPKDYENVISKIASDIALKDDSFKYKIVPSWYQENYKVLIVYSQDKDTAYKRGGWFRHILEKEYQLKLLYWVK